MSLEEKTHGSGAVSLCEEGDEAKFVISTALSLAVYKAPSATRLLRISLLEDQCSCRRNGQMNSHPRRQLKTSEILDVKCTESWLAGEGTQYQADGAALSPGPSPQHCPAPAHAGPLSRSAHDQTSASRKHLWGLMGNMGLLQSMCYGATPSR